MAEFVSRLLGRLAPEPDAPITLRVDPSCVIRSGDAVVLFAPRLSRHVTDRICEAAKQALPDGCRILLVSKEDLGLLRLPAPLEDVLSDNCSGGRDDRDPDQGQVERSAVEPSCCPTGHGDVIDERPADLVLDERCGRPEAVPEAAEYPHAPDRTSPTAQRPADQAAIDPPEGEHASRQAHERVDVRAGTSD